MLLKRSGGKSLPFFVLSFIDGVVFFLYQQKWVYFQGPTYAKQAGISWWSQLNLVGRSPPRAANKAQGKSLTEPLGPDSQNVAINEERVGYISQPATTAPLKINICLLLKR